MKIYSETSVRSFKFWHVAADFAAKLTCDECDMVEDSLNDIYPDGIDETQLNDIFWFDREFVCEIIGVSEDAIWAR